MTFGACLGVQHVALALELCVKEWVGVRHGAAWRRLTRNVTQVSNENPGLWARAARLRKHPSALLLIQQF